MIKNYLFYFFVGISELVNGQYIKINDPNFERVLIEMNFDVAPIDGKVNLQGIKKLRRLDLSRRDIIDISGISYFTSLTYLNLSNNPIKNEKIDLRNLTKLEELDLSGEIHLKELLLNQSSPIKKLFLCSVSNNLDISNYPLTYFSWRWNSSYSENVYELNTPNLHYEPDQEKKLYIYFFNYVSNGIRRGMSRNGKIYIEANFNNNQLNGDVFLYNLLSDYNLSEKKLLDALTFKNGLIHGKSRKYNRYFLFGEQAEEWQFEKFKDYNASDPRVIFPKNVKQKFNEWCRINQKDTFQQKCLMEYLWTEGVAQLVCGSGAESLDYMFKLNSQTKANASFQVFSIFDEYFKAVFPSANGMDNEWNIAFNYWYDKQKNICGY